MNFHALSISILIWLYFILSTSTPIKDKNSIFFGLLLPVIELILLTLLMLNDKDMSKVSFLAFSTISLIFSGSIDFTGLFFLENNKASFIIRIKLCFKLCFFLSISFFISLFFSLHKFLISLSFFKRFWYFWFFICWSIFISFSALLNEL